MQPCEAPSARRASAASIHGEIRDRICLLDYRPGCVLRETEIAAEFGVSRTPVREALQRLAVEGLVEIRNGIGTIVTRLDLAALAEIYEMRAEMALAIGKMRTRPLTAPDAEGLAALLLRARALGDPFDIREYWEINHLLHHTISDVILNRTFRETWDNLYFRAARTWYDLARTMMADARHLLISEIAELDLAVRERDIVAVGNIKRNYIGYSWHRIRANLHAEGQASAPATACAGK